MTIRDAMVEDTRVRVRQLAGANADGMVGYEKWHGFEHDGDRWAPAGHVYLKVGATAADAVTRLFGADAELLEPGAPEPPSRADWRTPCKTCGKPAASHNLAGPRSCFTVLCDGTRLIL